jgi:hypothetical protein
MIQPGDIRRKAENLYSTFLDAWLRGNLFFPKSIPGRKQPDEDLGRAITSVQRLRRGSKEILGYGYVVKWTEINSRRYGRNLFPERIVFETQSDFLRYLGKEHEFAAFAEAVGRIRSHYHELESWVRSNRALLMEVCGEVDGLLYIIEYLQSHPRPGVFAREIPGSLDTKFIERNRRVLREWLDLILPPQTIRADEEHFERRFGLRYAEPHVMLRFLDPDVQSACRCPWPELSLPLHTIGGMVIDVNRVLVVENKVSLLTLPALASTIALGGLGNSVTDLRYLPWLAFRAMWYWGDIDAEGLSILSRLRSIFPQTRSLLMDGETLACWRDQFAVPGTGRSANTPPGLTGPEQSAFRECVEKNLRLEQERIQQTFVKKALEASGFQLHNADDPPLP